MPKYSLDNESNHNGKCQIVCTGVRKLGWGMLWRRDGSLCNMFASRISQVVHGIWEQCQPLAILLFFIKLCLYLKLLGTQPQFWKARSLVSEDYVGGVGLC